MNKDLDFHIKRLEEARTYISRALKQGSRAETEAHLQPAQLLSRINAIMIALEEAEDILIEQLDKLEG